MKGILEIICMIVWVVTFIPGTYLDFKYPHTGEYKKLLTGAALRCVASLMLLAILFMK
jgi:hypothetical protein